MSTPVAALILAVIMGLACLIMKINENITKKNKEKEQDFDDKSTTGLSWKNEKIRNYVMISGVVVVAVIIIAVIASNGGFGGGNGHKSNWSNLSESEKQNARDAYKLKQWVDEQKGR